MTRDFRGYRSLATAVVQQAVDDARRDPAVLGRLAGSGVGHLWLAWLGISPERLRDAVEARRGAAGRPDGLASSPAGDRRPCGRSGRPSAGLDEV